MIIWSVSRLFHFSCSVCNHKWDVFNWPNWFSINRTRLPVECPNCGHADIPVESVENKDASISPAPT